LISKQAETPGAKEKDEGDVDKVEPEKAKDTGDKMIEA